MSPSFYLSPKGRITRSDYWLKFNLPLLGLFFLAAFLDISMGTFDEELGIGLFTGILSLLSFWPGIAVIAKRLHDRNKSGWFYILAMIPLINIWMAIEIGVLGGTPGDNYYGPDPRTEKLQNTASLA